MQDGVILARSLRQLLDSGGSGGVSAEALESALRGFEAQRVKRILPLTLRSHAFGRLLQLPFPPVSMSPHSPSS